MSGDAGVLTTAHPSPSSSAGMHTKTVAPSTPLRRGALRCLRAHDNYGEAGPYTFSAEAGLPKPSRPNRYYVWVRGLQ